MSGKTCQVRYITNAGADSGVGHRAEEIFKRLGEKSEVAMEKAVINGEKYEWLPKSLGWVIEGKRMGRSGADVSHFTNQTLSFMAKGKTPSVVTVHDIIEVTEPQDKRAYWLNKYLYSGMPKADHLICVSTYTKKMVQEHYGVPDERITVIHNGVGPEFHEIDNFKETVGYKETLRELRIPEGSKIVLYVGSDHPRKNVVGAVRAFAKVRNAYFLKIGSPGISAGREKLLDEIEEFKILDKVRIVNQVSREKLNLVYNLADVLIYPSKLEGFGLPPLQALAAGTPVVTSNVTSLPEVVGDAARLHDPDDIDGMSESLERILTDEGLARILREKGLERAQKFSWDVAVEKVANVYSKFV